MSEITEHSRVGPPRIRRWFTSAWLLVAVDLACLAGASGIDADYLHRAPPDTSQYCGTLLTPSAMEVWGIRFVIAVAALSIAASIGLPVWKARSGRIGISRAVATSVVLVLLGIVACAGAVAVLNDIGPGRVFCFG